MRLAANLRHSNGMLQQKTRFFLIKDATAGRLEKVNHQRFVGLQNAQRDVRRHLGNFQGFIIGAEFEQVDGISYVHGLL